MGEVLCTFRLGTDGEGVNILLFGVRSLFAAGSAASVMVATSQVVGSFGSRRGMVLGILCV